MLDQFVAVTAGAAPLWGPAESKLLARWIDQLLTAAP
jgi:hypothetical protein